MVAFLLSPHTAFIIGVGVLIACAVLLAIHAAQRLRKR